MSKPNEYLFKKQTPAHKKAMKKIAEELFDAGLTPDEIIDAGDYLLNEMSLEELTGESGYGKAKEKTNKSTNAKPAKSKPVKQDKPKSKEKGKPNKAGKADKTKSTGKTKGKKKGKR